MNTCKHRGSRARLGAIGSIGSIGTLVSLAAFACGCMSASPEERFGVTQEAALNPNALNPNALNPNALNPNALNPNMLSPNALNAVSSDVLRALQDTSEAGVLSRELLPYVVGCALGPDQSIEYTWTDACGAVHEESCPGLLGLAPDWETSPLDLPGQQWVSACVASRVNAEGVSVMLSSRGTNPALDTTPQERATYRTREAVWFGNVFSDTPAVYACYDPLSMIPSAMGHRVCAQPDLVGLLFGGPYDCGPIEVVGPCTDLLGVLDIGPCASQAPASEGRYLHDCVPPGSSVPIPSITTFLEGRVPW